MQELAEPDLAGRPQFEDDNGFLSGYRVDHDPDDESGEFYSVFYYTGGVGYEVAGKIGYILVAGEVADTMARLHPHGLHDEHEPSA